MMQTPTAKVIQTIKIPATPDGSPILASGMAMTEHEGIFVADELNHRVLGYDTAGDLRWISGSFGSGDQQFWYPKAVTVGWIESAGSRVRCLAVADSWNKRVSFLDLSGNLLQTWHSSGNISFGEIADLRHMDSGEGESRGTWLLLDQTRHRLIGVTESGRLLFNAGQELPSRRETGWRGQMHPDLQTLRESGALPHLPPRDFLYYPSRFLGHCPDPLLIWEPNSRSLKIALYGSFLPIGQLLPAGLEWIAAGGSFLLGCEASRPAVFCYDSEGAAFGPWICPGRPVPSNLIPPDCWVQDGSDLLRLQLSKGTAFSRRPIPFGVELLALSAARQAAASSIDPARKTIARLSRSMDDLGSMAEEMSNGIASQTPARDAFCSKRRIESVRNELLAHRERLVEDLDAFLSLAMDWKYASAAAGSRLRPGAVEPMSLLEELMRPLGSGFPNWVRAHDQLRLSQARLSLSTKVSEDNNPEAREITREIQSTLLAGIEWLYSTIGPGGGRTLHVWRPRKWLDGFFNGNDSTRIFVPIPGADRLVRVVFKEVRTIPVAAIGDRRRAQPFHMSMNRKGLLLVSLLGGNEVQCLDENGTVVMLLGGTGQRAGQLSRPTGVLFDDRERIWVADHGNQRLQVWSPPYDTASTAVVAGSANDPMEGPVALFQIATGEILIADALKNRIWSASADNKVRIWLNRPGSASGELLNPVFFSNDNTCQQETFWVVERANHRVQKLDQDRRSSKVLGGCGIGRNSLFAPRSLACLSDGTLIIAEDRNPGYLVFLTEEGEVFERMRLDYIPGTLLAAEDRLYVTDIAGDSIRVYLRI